MTIGATRHTASMRVYVRACLRASVRACMRACVGVHPPARPAPPRAAPPGLAAPRPPARACVCACIRARMHMCACDRAAGRPGSRPGTCTHVRAHAHVCILLEEVVHEGRQMRIDDRVALELQPACVCIRGAPTRLQTHAHMHCSRGCMCVRHLCIVLLQHIFELFERSLAICTRNHLHRGWVYVGMWARMYASESMHACE